MARKRMYEERKESFGVNLHPEVWRRVEMAAANGMTTRNAIIEFHLMGRFAFDLMTTEMQKRWLDAQRLRKEAA